MRRNIILLTAALICLPLLISAKELPAGVQKSIDSLMRLGLNKGYYPGASVVIGNRDGIMFEKCYGVHDGETKRPVTPDDVYDLASVTKVVSTTFAVMRLYDEKKIDLNKTIGDYISGFDGSPVAGIPISQLLTHTSGLPYFPAYSLLFENETGEKLTSTKFDEELYPLEVDRGCYMCASPKPVEGLTSIVPVDGYRRGAAQLWINPDVDSIVRAKIIESYRTDLRGRYRYSDTNFLILRQIIENITGLKLSAYVGGLFELLGMDNTGYNPLWWRVPQMVVPTEYDHMLQRGQILGYVHDDLAALNGGVEGNAGLFSNASDLSRFCEMLINDGMFRGERIISRATVRLFTSQPLTPKGIYRGLGFDMRKHDSELYPGFGHTGYTGTMIWVDPKNDVYMVFLSNRVYPTRLNTGLSASQLRTKMWEILKAM